MFFRYYLLVFLKRDNLMGFNTNNQLLILSMLKKTYSMKYPYCASDTKLGKKLLTWKNISNDSEGKICTKTKKNN